MVPNDGTNARRPRVSSSRIVGVIIHHPLQCSHPPFLLPSPLPSRTACHTLAARGREHTWRTHRYAFRCTHGNEALLPNLACLTCWKTKPSFGEGLDCMGTTEKRTYGLAPYASSLPPRMTGGGEFAGGGRRGEITLTL